MEILFLSPKTGVDSPPRERRTEPSIARSHAARVSQNRSRKNSKVVKEKSPTTTRISLPVPADQVFNLSVVAKSINKLPAALPGNSDPFASQAIEITPRVNELIQFFSTFYGSVGYQRNLTRSKFRSDFLGRTLSLVLQDPCSAQAFLSSFMTLRSFLSPENDDFQREKERLNNEASLALQSKFKNHDRESNAVLLALKYSFIAAAFDGNIIEATMHATMLKGLLFRKWETGQLYADIYDMIHTTYVDGQMALKHLTHTIFEMDWVEKVLAPIIAPAEKQIEQMLPMINAGLDDGIDDPPLRSLVTRVRTTRYLLSRPMPDTTETRALNLWLGLGSGTIQARVANYYHITQRQLFRTDISAIDRFSWLTRGAVALTMGLLVNTPESMALYKVQGPSDDKITARLREIITEISILTNHIPHNITSNYDCVHLWVYFMCAQNEQRILQEQNTLPVHQYFPNAFFTRVFAAQACRMQLFRWDQVQTSIERIVYFDVLTPNGAYWANEAINHLGRENTTNGLVQAENSMSMALHSPAQMRNAKLEM